MNMARHPPAEYHPNSFTPLASTAMPIRSNSRRQCLKSVSWGLFFPGLVVSYL